MAFPNTTDDLDDLLGIELEGDRGFVYRVERRLGGGGQGCVFLATRRTPAGEDAVVVKIFRPSFVLSAPEIADIVLRKEFVALARLNDRVPPTPFVVRLLDGGEVEVLQRFQTFKLPWLAIEYVHGGQLGTTLRERVLSAIASEGAAFSPARLRRVLGAIVSGVHAIHEVGIVHRDLKPTNVLVCGVAEVELAKISDFGIARPMGMAATFSSVAVGTPGYAAPEQMDVAHIGPWSDVFSVAALAYFTLSGEEMFQGSPMLQVANAYAGRFPPLATRPNLHPALRGSRRLVDRIEAVLRQATLKDLTARTSSIGEFWSQLDPLLSEATTEGRLSLGTARTHHDSTPYRFTVAHRPETSLGLRAVAFDPDGRALALGEAGLLHFEGSRWLSVPPPSGMDVSSLRWLRRAGPERWMAGGGGGEVITFTPGAVEHRARVAPPDATLLALGLSPHRHACFVAARPGSPPLLVASGAGAARPPVAVEFAERIEAVAPAGYERWCVAGRDSTGGGLLATFDAASGTLERYPLESAPLFAAAADSTGTVFVVGQGGFGFRKREGHPVLERVLSHRTFTVVDVDPSDCVWAAAVGRVLRRPPGLETPVWTPLWSDASWSSPFVAISAQLGMVTCAAEDGSVLVGREIR